MSIYPSVIVPNSLKNIRGIIEKGGIMKKLPVGINDFKQIIEGNYIYVDKTEYLYEMTTTGMYYFLSRPRRFGKSLTVSTLYYLFSGQKELFKDTWIYDKWDWEKEKHPVIVLDMNRLNTQDIESMRKRLEMILQEHARFYEVQLQDDTIDGKFEQLIKKTYEKTNRTVVLLIDEYEKPILDHITNKRKIEEMRDELRQFYGKIKSLGSCLRFVFITGITKFTKMGVFSALNNLRDISFSTAYSQMLGYTNQEIEKYFTEHIDSYLKQNYFTKEEFFEKLEDYYDGFCFDGKHKVYNPFAVLLFFSEGRFKEYWSESGAPQFLYEYFIDKKVKIHELLLENRVTELELSSREIEDTTPKVFLVQAGYLTFNKEIKPGEYEIGFPNIDVSKSISRMALEVEYQIEQSRITQISHRIDEHIKNHDIEGLMRLLQSVIGGISYRTHESIEKHQADRLTILEAYYQSLIYAFLSASGYDVQIEQEVSSGRIDLVLKTNGTVYIFELKVDQPADKAIEQIKAKRYHQSYRYKKCYLVGISISSKERNIKEWKVEGV